MDLINESIEEINIKIMKVEDKLKQRRSWLNVIKQREKRNSMDPRIVNRCREDQRSQQSDIDSLEKKKGKLLEKRKKLAELAFKHKMSDNFPLTWSSSKNIN
jgi:septation ring formation regulator EzrA